MAVEPNVHRPRLAAKCAFLKVTMGERAGGHLINLCLHIVREGRDCVGPFLDDHETPCGLWEPQSKATEHAGP